LLRIKEADPAYFQECVSIFSVYTPGHNHQRCLDFTRGLGALLCQHFPAEYTGVFVEAPEETWAKHAESLPQRLAAFQAKAAVAASAEKFDANDFANLFPFAKLNFDHPSGQDALQLLLTCPMGFDNLMVAANGDFLICHKVDEGMPIGSCQNGLDMERLVDLNLRYNASINSGECRNCWGVRFCSACAAARMVGDGFVNPTQAECDCLRQRIAYDFLCFIHLSQAFPELLERIFAHTRDRKSLLGVTDFHDL
jgi:uncharacterized protein